MPENSFRAGAGLAAGSALSRGCSIGVLIGAIFIGCDEPLGPSLGAPDRVDSDWVTGEAASAVDPTTGQFTLPAVTGTHVSLSSAQAVAVAVVRLWADPDHAGNIREILAQDRGGPIAFGELRVCSRPVYVRSAFVDFPAAAPRWLARAHGPQWAIPFCGRHGAAQLSVGVPDNPMDISLVNGEIVIPETGGESSFTGVGIPHRFPSGMPVSPEAAVGAVAQRTGKRIVRVPVPYNQLTNGVGEFPVCASWRVEIEEAVDVRSEVTGQVRSVREFYVRHFPSCFSDSIALHAAEPTQPVSRWLRFRVEPAGTGLPEETDSVQVQLAGPIFFERVTVVGAPAPVGQAGLGLVAPAAMADTTILVGEMAVHGSLVLIANMLRAVRLGLGIDERKPAHRYPDTGPSTASGSYSGSRFPRSEPSEWRTPPHRKR
jgi:hypothetical protein